MLVQHSGRLAPSLEVLADLRTDTQVGPGQGRVIQRGRYELGAMDLHWDTSEHALGGTREVGIREHS